MKIGKMPQARTGVLDGTYAGGTAVLSIWCV